MNVYKHLLGMVNSPMAGLCAMENYIGIAVTPKVQWTLELPNQSSMDWEDGFSYIHLGRDKFSTSWQYTKD